MPPTPQSPMVRVELKVLGQPVAVEITQPPDPARLDELLPLLQAIEGAALDVAVRAVESEGKTVSCRKGCSACCRRQAIPVTPPEAYALWRLVEDLPEPRRGEVKERFAEGVRRFRESGLDRIYLRRDPPPSQDELITAGRSYFRLDLACPFLDADACSIHPARPIVCRQYLVTSPAELCDNPFENSIEPVPLAAARATLQAAEEVLGTPQYMLPLILALEYAETHRTELEQTFPATDIARRMLGALGRKPPGSGGAGTGS